MTTTNKVNKNFIQENNVNLAKSFNMVCLRNIHTNRIENVAHSEQGLQWTVDKYGKSLYYDPSTTKVSPQIWDSTATASPTQYVTTSTATENTGIYTSSSTSSSTLFVNFVKGDKRRNSLYKVEPYTPINHIDESGNPIGVSPKDPLYGKKRAAAHSKQLAELTFLDKCVRIGLFTSSYTY